MGKIGKPQKKKKNKIRTFGWHKNEATLNRAPKCLEQEVPRRLLELGIAIKETQSGKSDKNKFKNKPDGPDPNDTKMVLKGKKYALKPFAKEEAAKMKMGKQMQKMTLEATEEYINDLKPARPFLENFEFKKKSGESKQEFMIRVQRESLIAVSQSKISDKKDRSAKFLIKSRAREKLLASKKEKLQKEKAKEQEAPKPTVEKEEKQEKREFKDFHLLKDEIVPFGEVVHAPPTLSVLPKKARAQGRDRPGARMPELKEAFSQGGKGNTDKTRNNVIQRKKGKTVKRKNLTLQQQFESDAKREQFVELYRQMKKDAKLGL